MLMCKYPTNGIVKTRLAKSIGEISAVKIYNAMLHDIIKQHTNQSYTLKLIIPQNNKEFIEKFHSLLPDVQIFLGDGNNLRGKDSQLWFAFNKFFPKYTKVIAIYSDVPNLTTEVIYSAFELLDKNDVVIGPSSGSYYLIGLRKLVDIFTEVPQKYQPYLQYFQSSLVTLN